MSGSESVTREEIIAEMTEAEKYKQALQAGKGWGWVVVTAFLGWCLTSADQGAQSFALPGILAAFKISVSQWGVILDISLVFGWIFATLAGPLLERYGRKRVFTWLFIIAAVGSFLSGLAINIVMLAIFRLITLMGNAAEQVAAQTLTSEMVPEKRRGFLISLVQAGYQTGFVIAAAFSLLLLPLAPIEVSWRYLFMAIAVPSAIVAYLRFKVPESPRFLALDAARKAYKIGDIELVNRIKQIFNIEEKKAVKFPIRQLFYKDTLRSAIVLPTYTFLKGWEFAFTSFIILYLTQVKGFSGSTADFITLFALAFSVLGYWTTGYLGDIIGRREIALIDLVGAAIMSFVFVFTHGLTPIEEIFVYGLFAFFGFGVWAANFGLYTEAFPTRARGSGTGLCGAMYWLGGIFWTTLASIVLIPHYGLQLAYIILAPVANVLCPIVLAFLKRIPPRKALEEIHI